MITAGVRDKNRGFPSATIWAVLRRWFHILIYGVIAAVLAMPLGRLVDHAFTTLTAFRAGDFPIYSQVLRGVSCLGLIFLVIHQTGTRFIHLRWLIRYPPTIVGAVVGVCGVFGLAWFTDPEFAASGAAMATVFALSIVLLLVLMCLTEVSSKRKPASKLTLTRPSEITLEALAELPMEKLHEWLSTESAIDATVPDLFGATERARQIWKALQTQRADVGGLDLRQTVVIQGHFGAGKTSVVRLVEDLANNAKGERYIFAHVNCWGFSSIAAQEHILQQAVEELSHTVDCLALRRLPTAYADAIRKSNWWFGILASMSIEAKEPAAQLKRFTPLLRALGAQLVIVVEDTDRNGADFDQTHIEAMLYRFREVERVSFILTAGSKSDIDFPKIAEHILFLSPLRPNDVLALINRVRDHCRTAWSFIDPTAGPYPSRNRPDRLRAGSPAWSSPLVGMLNNPRRLKKTLAEIMEKWAVLHGEVDLDELIMITALRHTAPRVFSFFGSHFREFKSVTTEPEKTQVNGDREEARKSRLVFLKERWRAAVSELEDDSSYLAAILGELILSSTKITSCSIFTTSNRSQTINEYSTGSRADIYWERLAAGSLPRTVIHDQEVLTALFKAADGVDIDSFGRRFAASKEFAELALFFERFVQRVNEKAVLQIATPTLQALRPLPSPTMEPGALFYLARWLDKLPYNEPAYRQWLATEMERCLPQGLLDAEQVFWRFGKSKLDTDALASVRQQLVTSMRNHFESASAHDFAVCFRGSYPYSLGHLVHCGEKSGSDKFLTKPSEWIWLQDKLIDGMIQEPQTMIPQVMMLFGEFGPGGQTPTYFKYDEEKYRELFGDQWPEALRLLTQDIVVASEADGWFRLAAPLGTAEARRLAEGLVDIGEAPTLSRPSQSG